MTSRTSLSHPLQIAEVSAPGAKGAIGITFCPGKKQASAMSGVWDRDLGLDLDAIKAWGASAIITLIEPHEIRDLKVEGIDEETERRGMEWLHMPIKDVSAPDERFAKAWRQHGARLVDRMRAGDRVLVHCKGGLGRAGTVTALMLVELGVPPDEAIRSVRKVRKGAIETREQEGYIHTHAGRQVIEKILEVGAEGGSISLVCRKGPAGSEYRVQTSEAALHEDDPDLAVPMRPWVASWNEAIAQLDNYPWTRLKPLMVSREFSKRIVDEVKERCSEGGAEWKVWERFC